MQKHALQVAKEELEGIPVLRAAGELDLATIPELRVVFNEITDQSPRAIIFDFAGITYLDSSGLGILVSAKRRLGGHGGEVIVISDSSCVLKALALSGLDQIIRVFQSEQEFREARVPS